MRNPYRFLLCGVLLMVCCLEGSIGASAQELNDVEAVIEVTAQTPQSPPPSESVVGLARDEDRETLITQKQQVQSESQPQQQQQRKFSFRSCNTSHQGNLIRWNEDTLKWVGKPNECFKYNFDAPETLKLLQGKTILFVGDSTVRNVAQVLVASLCNPDHMLDCAQRMEWPITEEKTEHAMNCAANKPWETESQIAKKAESWCNDTSKVNITFHQLRYLTADRYTLTRKQRKEFWFKGISPAVIHINILGINILVLEASCIKQNDGLNRALKWLVNYKIDVREGTLNENVTWDSDLRPFQHPVPDWDLLVTSGGFHCTYHEYQKPPGWYGKVAERLKSLTHYSPVLWLEAHKCTKTNSSHVLFHRSKPNALKEHKLASCDFIDGYSGTVRDVVRKHGAIISPTYHYTENISETTAKPLTQAQDQHPCVMADLMHPGVKCYRQMLQTHLSSMRVAFENWKPPPPGSTAWVAPTPVPKPPRTWPPGEGPKPKRTRAPRPNITTMADQEVGSRRKRGGGGGGSAGRRKGGSDPANLGVDGTQIHIATLAPIGGEEPTAVAVPEVAAGTMQPVAPHRDDQEGKAQRQQQQRPGAIHMKGDGDGENMRQRIERVNRQPQRKEQGPQEGEQDENNPEDNSVQFSVVLILVVPVLILVRLVSRRR